MDNKGLYKTGLIFALLTALGWIIFVAGMVSSTQGDAPGEVARYIAQSESTALLMYTWGGILGSLAVIPVFLAIFQGFRQETGSVLAVPVTFGLIGVGFLTMGFMVDSGSLIYYFGPAIANANVLETGFLVQAAQFAQDSIEVTWAIGSILAYGGSILWIAFLLFRTSRVPKWLNLAGIIGGLAGFVWAIRFLPIPAPQSVGIILLFLNILLAMVWLLGLSIILVRSGEQDTEATQPSP